MSYDASEQFASDGTRNKNYAYGLINGRDTIICSKGQAFKPREKKSSHHKLQYQKHKVHVVLNSNSKIPQKRKFDQYINVENFGTSHELINKEKDGSENVKVQKRNRSLSCSTLMDGKEYGSPARSDKTEFCIISKQDYSHLSDSDDFVEGQNNLMNLPSLNTYVRGLMASGSYSCRTKTSIKEKHKDKDIDLINSLKKFLPSRGNHLRRPIIPIGPRFQAKVPKWEATTNKKQYNSDDCLRWLGTQIWPTSFESPEKGIGKECITGAKGIGICELDSGSSGLNESLNCVKKYIGEVGKVRECLKQEINTNFSSCKFDDVGDVSKSWTMEEQKNFETLVKSNPISSNTRFWKLAMEYFPFKSIKCIINYYYNVYIPRCMSMETRSPFCAVDRQSK